MDYTNSYTNSLQNLQQKLNIDGCEYLLFIIDVHQSRSLLNISEKADQYFRYSGTVYKNLAALCEKYNVGFDFKSEIHSLIDHAQIDALLANHDKDWSHDVDTIGRSEFSIKSKNKMLQEQINDIDDSFVSDDGFSGTTEDDIDSNNDNDNDIAPISIYRDSEKIEENISHQNSTNPQPHSNKNKRCSHRKKQCISKESVKSHSFKEKNSQTSTISKRQGRQKYNKTDATIEGTETAEMDQKISEDSQGFNYSCNFCGRIFVKQKKAYLKHVKSHRNGLNFECQFCARVFVDRRRYTEHVRFHVKRYSCTVCDKKFPTLPTLEKHTATHSKAKLFICDICGKKLKNKQTLRHHRRIHDDENAIYGCDVCGKRFIQHIDLRKHLPIHDETKPFICHVCGRGFVQNSALTKHQSTHTTELKFECDICHKKFKLKKSLRAHTICKHLSKEEADNLSENVFTCGTCQRLFPSPDLMRAHERVHTGEKPFVCKICGKAFADKRNCKSHEKVHENDRPHKCEVCNKGFIHPRDLRRHMLTHNSTQEINNQYPTPITDTNLTSIPTLDPTLVIMDHNLVPKTNFVTNPMHTVNMHVWPQNPYGYQHL